MFLVGSARVPFENLSAGEQELAFLAGQIERFGLRHGFLLLDEPELCLNPDLMRRWLTYVKSTIEEGQVWIATHSLEAVEASGAESAFLLECDNNRCTRSARQHSQHALIRSLARSLGTPAFAIDRLRFVFVEGENQTGERERFARLCAIPSDVRIIVAGSCGAVRDAVRSVTRLAEEANQPVRFGGVVDADHRTTEGHDLLEAEGIFVLGVHEIENFFLYPPALNAALSEMGQNRDVLQLLQVASDQRAGIWLVGHILASLDDNRTRNAIHRELRARLAGKAWNDINTGPLGERAEKLATGLGAGVVEHGDLNLCVARALSAYQSLRTGSDLWRQCEGKQVSEEVAGSCGLKGAATLEAAVVTRYEREPDLIPDELRRLRKYMRGTV